MVIVMITQVVLALVVCDADVISLVAAANELVHLIDSDGVSSTRKSCMALSEELFRPASAVRQILAALKGWEIKYLRDNNPVTHSVRR